MKIKLLLLVLIALCIGGLHAEYEELINQAKELYTTIKTYEADIMILGSTSAAIDNRATGRILINNKTTVVDIATPHVMFIKYDKGKKNTYIQQPNVAIQSEYDDKSPDYLFNPANLAAVADKLVFERVDKRQVIFSLKSEEEDAKEDDLIYIYIGERDGLISRITDKSGDLRIDISEQKFNKPLSKKTSFYVVPTNARIITEDELKEEAEKELAEE